MPTTNLFGLSIAPEADGTFEDYLKFQRLAGRRFYMTETVDEGLADNFRAWTDAMAGSGSEPIEIVINSPGGYVVSGFGIIGQVRSLQRRGIRVTALVVGDAASMAAVIAAACDRCEITSLGRLMWHGIQGSSRGDLTDIDEQKAEMERLGNRLVAILTKRARDGSVYADADHVKKLMREKRPVWIYPEEALEAGLVDEIVE